MDLQQLISENKRLREENERFRRIVSVVEEKVNPQEHQLLKSILSTASVVFFAIDAKGLFTFSEGEGLKKLGLKPGQVVGMSVFDVYKDFPDIIKSVREALKGKTIINTTQIGELYFRTNFTPVHESISGRISGIVGYAIDNTEETQKDKLLNDTREELEVTLEELRAGEQKLQILLNNLNDPVFVHEIFPDRPGNFSWVNKAATKILGYTYEEFMNLSPLSLDEPITAKRVIKPTIELLNKNGKAVFETILVSKSGQHFDMEVNSAVYKMDGKPYVISIARDITGRKKIQQALREAKEFNDEILEHAPVGIVTFNSKGNCTTANNAACQILNQSRESLLEFNFHNSDLIKKTELYQDTLDALLKGETKHGEFWLPVSANHKIYFEYFISRFVLNEEPHVLGIFLDNTEKKSYELDRERYFSTTLALLCTATMDGHFKSLNPSWKEVLGYTKEELRSKPFLHFVHPDDVENTVKVMKQLDKGEKAVNFINRYRCKDGNYKFLSWFSAPFGDVIYASAIDITELKEKELKLQQANNTRDKLFSIISHDLKSPLGTLMNSLELIAEEEDAISKKTQDLLLKELFKTSKNTFNLLENLLSWSRTQLGSIKMSPEQNKIHDVLQNIIKLQQNLADQKAIKINIDIGKEQEIYADFNSLTVILRNLISNAIKFTPPKGTINIRLSFENNFQNIHIKDTGVGMSKDLIDKVMNPNDFYTTRGTSNEIGTGLGLKICKELIDLHSGQLKIISKQGQGTEFIVLLPSREE